MNRVLRIITVMPLLFILLLASCDKEEHKEEYPLPDGQGALVIGWESEAEVNSLAVYLFDSSGITVLYNKVYDNPHEVTSEYIPMAGGDYTLLMVANADSTALPQETTVADLTEWLKAHAGDYPKLLTASAQIEVIPGDIHRLTLELKDGTSGINLATVTLRLALPDKTMPDYPASRSADGKSQPLRCVAEVWQAGTDNCVHHRIQDCTLQADGTYLAELSLMPGNYDLRLWADWNGGYYNTDDLSAVTVLTDSYVANGETDKKDAYYTASVLNVGEEYTEQAITLTRPFARYPETEARQVGADFVLTNGEESFVTVTIQMVDTNTGDIVATMQHVKIPYKRGHLTTVTGHFLTAGMTPGGVQIDIEWGDDITIES